MKKGSLTVKIILIVVVLVFPVNAFLLYYAQRSQAVILENENNNTQNIARLYMNDLESRIRSINNYIVSIEGSDENVGRLVSEQNWDDYYISAMGLRNSLDDHMTISQDADCYFFYLPERAHGMMIEKGEHLTTGSVKELYYSDDIDFHTKRWQIVDADNGKWLVHVTTFHDLYIGAGIHLDTIEAEIRQLFSYDEIEVAFAPSATMRTGHDMEYTSQASFNNQFYLNIAISKGSIIRNLPILQRWGYQIALAELLIIPILIYTLSVFVLRPLEILNAALKQLKDAPDARIMQSANTDDFAHVYEAFNGMADEMVQLTIDNYEQKIRQQRINMRNLQLQVKPHFLFNSFNLMYNLVQMGEYKSAQQMILYLSDYFHYVNLGMDDFSRFGDELELIRKYLEVSKIRYPDIIEVIYDIRDDVQDVQVPQLLIHNFVGNIIKHGLALKRKNHILIQAFIDGGEAVFRVEDDGVGMPREHAETINRAQFQYADGKNHLGIKNSYDRVQFLYGDKGHIYIQSATDQGTIVMVTLPAYTQPPTQV